MTVLFNRLVSDLDQRFLEQASVRMWILKLLQRGLTGGSSSPQEAEAYGGSLQ